MIDTLTESDPSRKAYRLFGGVLVERTTADILPDVKQNREWVRRFRSFVLLARSHIHSSVLCLASLAAHAPVQITKAMETLAVSLKQKEAEASAWQKKYNIRTAKDEALQGRGGGQRSSQGVLA